MQFNVINKFNLYLDLYDLPYPSWVVTFIGGVFSVLVWVSGGEWSVWPFFGGWDLF